MSVSYVISLLSFCLDDVPFVKSGVLKFPINNVWASMCDFNFNNVSFTNMDAPVLEA